VGLFGAIELRTLDSQRVRYAYFSLPVGYYTTNHWVAFTVRSLAAPSPFQADGVCRRDWGVEGRPRIILSNFSKLTKYYMIDPWAHLQDWNKPFNVDDCSFEDIYAEALLKTDFASSRRIVLRGRTSAVIDEIPDQSLDFAYIDGDHTLKGITIDLIQVFPQIKDGGLIGGDDFVDKPWQHGAAYEPTLICPFAAYFAEAMRLPFVALPHKQFLIQKATDTAFSFIDLVGTYSDLSLNKLSHG
jgi:hypothetical protein